MDNGSIVQILGGALLVLYLFFGIDDFVWFLFSTVAGFFRKKDEDEVLDFKKLRRTPPKLLAVCIAAWHESNVIEDVLTNFLNTTDYPKSMYHIFVGVYPNDPATIEKVRSVSRVFPNVHAAINDLDGPTTKAQNINCAIRHIRRFEQENHLRFASLTIHDSEDVVHPYELLATNYLVDRHDALQFPVFPILELPRFRNFFRQMTTATYADEFAESHYVALVERNSTGAFVPSAGTGFALSRKTLESFHGEDVLPTDALTEDYLLSLALFKRGIPMYYVLNRLPRLLKSGEIRTDFLATRSLFPSTFRAAVRQKARWTYGITMQSIHMRDVFTSEHISFAGRYSFYKDAKSKLVNLIPLFGYAASIYCIFAMIFGLDYAYAPGSVLYYISIAVFCLMVLRLILRGYSLYRVYGFRSVFFGCLLPPLFPIRLIYGNIINFTATCRAFRMRYFSTGKKPDAPKDRAEQSPPPAAKPQADASGTDSEAPGEGEQKVTWDKTEHNFLNRQQLRPYRRMLGDVLITQSFLTPEQLRDALASMDREHGEHIGSYLIRQGVITEEEFMSSLGHVKHIQYIPSRIAFRLGENEILGDFDPAFLREKKIVPLAYEGDVCIIGICSETKDDAVADFAAKYHLKYRRMFLMEDDLARMLRGERSPEAAEPLASLALFRAGLLSYEQMVLIGIYAELLDKSEQEICQAIGLQAEYLHAAG